MRILITAICISLLAALRPTPSAAADDIRAAGCLLARAMHLELPSAGLEPGAAIRQLRDTREWLIHC